MMISRRNFLAVAGAAAAAAAVAGMCRHDRESHLFSCP